MAVTLNPLDANLNLQLLNGNLVAKPLSQGALALLWGGVRGTLGVCAGKYYFRVKVEDNIPANPPPAVHDADLGPLHLCRIGISVLGTDVANLGDQLGTWMYSSTGVVADGPSFIGQERARPYGEPFFPGDEICCFVDAASRPGSVSFTKNGKWLGQAFSLQSVGDVPLFPHLLLRNVQCRVSFHGPPKQDYQPWQAAMTQVGHFQLGPPPHTIFQRCEVLVMVGMPGCGKTTWCQEEIVQNPGKRYVVLSTTGVLVQMKVPGLKEGHHRHGVTVSPMMKNLENAALEANNLLQKFAPNVARNYIIDHTNLFEKPRTKKVEPFARAGFNVQATVIIIPDPVLFERQGRSFQEEGKSVSDSKIASCRASFSIPEVGPLFREVFFVEAQPPEAFAIVHEQREAGKLALMASKGTKRGAAAPAKTSSKRSRESHDHQLQYEEEPWLLDNPIMGGAFPAAQGPMFDGSMAGQPGVFGMPPGALGFQAHGPPALADQPVSMPMNAARGRGKKLRRKKALPGKQRAGAPIPKPSLKRPIQRDQEQGIADEGPQSPAKKSKPAAAEERATALENRAEAPEEHVEAPEQQAQAPEADPEEAHSTKHAAVEAINEPQLQQAMAAQAELDAGREEMREAQAGLGASGSDGSRGIQAKSKGRVIVPQKPTRGRGYTVARGGGRSFGPGRASGHAGGGEQPCVDGNAQHPLLLSQQVPQVEQAPSNTTADTIGAPTPTGPPTSILAPATSKDPRVMGISSATVPTGATQTRSLQVANAAPMPSRSQAQLPPGTGSGPVSGSGRGAGTGSNASPGGARSTPSTHAAAAENIADGPAQGAQPGAGAQQLGSSNMPGSNFSDAPAGRGAGRGSRAARTRGRGAARGRAATSSTPRAGGQAALVASNNPLGRGQGVLAPSSTPRVGGQAAFAASNSSLGRCQGVLAPNGSPHARGPADRGRTKAAVVGNRGSRGASSVAAARRGGRTVGRLDSRGGSRSPGRGGAAAMGQGAARGQGNVPARVRGQPEFRQTNPGAPGPGLVHAGLPASATYAAGAYHDMGAPTGMPTPVGFAAAALEGLQQPGGFPSGAVGFQPVQAVATGGDSAAWGMNSLSPAQGQAGYGQAFAGGSQQQAQTVTAQGGPQQWQAQQTVFPLQQPGFAPQQPMNLSPQPAHLPQQTQYAPQQPMNLPLQPANPPQQTQYAPQQSANTPQQPVNASLQPGFASQQTQFAAQPLFAKTAQQPQYTAQQSGTKGPQGPAEGWGQGVFSSAAQFLGSAAQLGQPVEGKQGGGQQGWAPSHEAPQIFNGMVQRAAPAARHQQQSWGQGNERPDEVGQQGQAAPVYESEYVPWSGRPKSQATKPSTSAAQHGFRNQRTAHTSLLGLEEEHALYGDSKPASHSTSQIMLHAPGQVHTSRQQQGREEPASNLAMKEGSRSVLPEAQGGSSQGVINSSGMNLVSWDQVSQVGHHATGLSAPSIPAQAPQAAGSAARERTQSWEGTSQALAAGPISASFGQAFRRGQGRPSSNDSSVQPQQGYGAPTKQDNQHQFQATGHPGSQQGPQLGLQQSYSALAYQSGPSLGGVSTQQTRAAESPPQSYGGSPSAQAGQAAIMYRSQNVQGGTQSAQASYNAVQPAHQGYAQGQPGAQQAYASAPSVQGAQQGYGGAQTMQQGFAQGQPGAHQGYGMTPSGQQGQTGAQKGTMSAQPSTGHLLQGYGVAQPAQQVYGSQLPGIAQGPKGYGAEAGQGASMQTSQQGNQQGYGGRQAGQAGQVPQSLSQGYDAGLQQRLAGVRGKSGFMEGSSMIAESRFDSDYQQVYGRAQQDVQQGQYAATVDMRTGPGQSFAQTGNATGGYAKGNGGAAQTGGLQIGAYQQAPMGMIPQPAGWQQAAPPLPSEPGPVPMQQQQNSYVAQAGQEQGFAWQHHGAQRGW